jgi:hypothetical protein
LVVRQNVFFQLYWDSQYNACRFGKNGRRKHVTNDCQNVKISFKWPFFAAIRLSCHLMLMHLAEPQDSSTSLFILAASCREVLLYFHLLDEQWLQCNSKISALLLVEESCGGAIN